jgi:hypothetical protein
MPRRPLGDKPMTDAERQRRRRERLRRERLQQEQGPQSKLLQEIAGLRRQLDRQSAAAAREKLELCYETLTNNLFNETEFMTLLACVHPDNSASEHKRDTAFKALNAMKFQLTGKR